MFFRKWVILLTLVVSLGLLPRVYAREVQRGSGVSASCGDIIEGEFTNNSQEETYFIELKAGDSLEVSLAPLGERLKTAILVTGPSNIGLAISNGDVGTSSANFVNVESQPTASTGIVSASGTYTIRIVNFHFSGKDYFYGNDTYPNGVANSGGIGIYTLYVGCTLRDSTVINPGDTAPVSDDSNIHPPVNSAFSGNGFPGLAPVDFSNAIKVSLNLNEPNEGEIPTLGNNVLGFKFKANAGDKMDLSFTRTSGNLNLGLVVLSSTNQVIYMAALINSETMSTLFSLPDAGEYTIGVFKLDLLPPSAPVNTTFQLQATLNS